MDGARVEVRRRAGDARAVVLGLPDVVRIRDAGSVGVDHAEQDVVGVEPGIRGEALQWRAVGQVGAGEQVADHGKAVQLDAAHQRGETVGTGLAHHGLVARALVGLELAGAVFLEDIDDLVGDLLGGLIPGDALPLARAPLTGALERVAQAVGLIHGGGVDGALLTAARVGVGHLGIDLRILGDLFLAQDDAVLHIDVPATVAHAIDAVSGVADAVPGPLVAVQVFPTAVGILAGQGIADRLQTVEGPDVAAEQGAGARHPQPLQDIASLDLPHAHDLLLIKRLAPADNKPVRPRSSRRQGTRACIVGVWHRAPSERLDQRSTDI